MLLFVRGIVVIDGVPMVYSVITGFDMLGRLVQEVTAFPAAIEDLLVGDIVGVLETTFTYPVDPFSI